jgi:rhodanese-related sulfurtransferase
MKSKSMRVFLSLTTLLCILFAVQQIQAAEEVDVIQAQSMSRQGALLLDVREPDEYAKEHAPNAMLIPLGQISSRMQEIAAYKDKPVDIMCHSGRRSAKAAKMLQEAGFRQVHSIRGGIVAWEKAGLKVVAGQYTRTIRNY